MRPPREGIYIDFASHWAMRSTCKRLKVGAVITTNDLRQVIAVGYNGPAKGLGHARCRGNQPGKCGCLHAEMNAIAQADSRIPEKTIFVTHFPCEICAQLIVQNNITRVYFKFPYRGEEMSQVVFEKCGIEVYRCIPEIEKTVYHTPRVQ
jgi:dCMP deaminase